MDSPPFAFSASFQLTSSRRGWRLCNSWFGCRRGISTHILTKRMTTNPTITFKAGTFQLTSSRRGWPNAYKRGSSCGRYFNSHPHEEDDYTSFFSNDFESISTHILTKRMTMCHAFWIPHCIFQLTSSRRGWLALSRFLVRSIYYFNSHPHEEDDLNSYGTKPRNSISTHILTKRMTATRWNLCREVRDFNSHPHEEDDCFPHPTLPVYRIFQLTSSRRGWLECGHGYQTHWVFQLTSSRRGWQWHIKLMC